MAIVNCPSCNQKTSDKAKTCANCQHDFVNKLSANGLTDEQISSKLRLKHIKKKYSLQMQAMIGIILVLLGSSLWYFDGRSFSKVSDFLELAMIALGAFWYLTTRVRLIIFKKST